MRIGFDVDGVLGDYPQAYQALIQRVTGRNLFQPGDAENPPTWYWPELRGYTKSEMQTVWEHILEAPDFWQSLLPLPGVAALDPLIPALEDHHDVYYITARPGRTAKRQTERWLRRQLGYGFTPYEPTVLISHSKDDAVWALDLHVYIDDNLDNANAVYEHTEGHTRTYLLDRRYNQGETDATRVPTVQAMIDLELANL